MEINNRKANYDYEIVETIETGIVLKGTEIKSIRDGKANLKDSYAIVSSSEAPGSKISVLSKPTNDTEAFSTLLSMSYCVYGLETYI